MRLQRQLAAEGIRHRAAMALHVTDLATAEPELRQQHEQQQGQEYRRERRHRSMISSRAKPSDYTGRSCMAQAPNWGQGSNTLIWIDLEMTGLNPETDRVIEV